MLRSNWMHCRDKDFPMQWKKSFAERIGVIGGIGMMKSSSFGFVFEEWLLSAASKFDSHWIWFAVCLLQNQLFYDNNSVSESCLIGLLENYLILTTWRGVQTIPFAFFYCFRYFKKSTENVSDLVAAFTNSSSVLLCQIDSEQTKNSYFVPDDGEWPNVPGEICHVGKHGIGCNMTTQAFLFLVDRYKEIRIFLLEDDKLQNTQLLLKTKVQEQTTMPRDEVSLQRTYSLSKRMQRSPKLSNTIHFRAIQSN